MIQPGSQAIKHADEDCTGPLPVKGRGALSDASGRYEALERHRFIPARVDADGEPLPIRTHLHEESCRSILTRNQSPDVPFNVSLNPYRGCEHGCIYCYARPSHARYGFSPGLDFETELVWKPDAAKRLREALSARGYRPEPIALGVNTDCYQPVERRLRLTRSCLQVLQATRHPVVIVTKSALIERDLDILADMAADRLVKVMVSVTTVDPRLSRLMEPRAASPNRRLELIRRMHRAGIPVGVLVAPLIPVLTDSELETLLARVAEAGAVNAAYMLLRLPDEVQELFQEWLHHHFPDRAQHVLNRLRDLRGGQLNDPRFHQRMRGDGPYAELIARRFALAVRRLGLDRDQQQLNTEAFCPVHPGGQLSLFATPRDC